VPVWIAERESQWGDHYQFIATKSSLGRAVSKQVLSKKGLVSCLDYYMERHAWWCERGNLYLFSPYSIATLT